MPVDAERQFQDMGYELRRAERHGLRGMGPGLMALQIVVRSVVDSADLLESAQALLPNLDIEVDLVVERTFLLVELREAERIPRDPQEIQIEALDLHEVIDVPRRQSVAHEVLGGCVMGRGGGFLGGPGHADRDGRDVLEGHGVPERHRVEENLKLRLDEFPHPVRALPRTDLVPGLAPDDGEPHREFAAERLELPLEVQEHALAVSGRRYARSFPVGPTSSGNIMWNSREGARGPLQFGHRILSSWIRASISSVVRPSCSPWVAASRSWSPRYDSPHRVHVTRMSVK